ncbi:MAG TPA: signal peptidase I [Coriobacteriia bacterium]|nr:signal peptidase I [Coriobacteriia bacterium]
MAKNPSNAPMSGSSDAGAQETSFGRWLLETIVLVALAFALAQGIKAFVVQPFVVPTGSMLPTIELKDRLLAEKITYRFVRPPRQGEIVVFANPDSSDPVARILIKRVIATGGQTVDIKDEQVYVDGKKLDEPYTYGKPSALGTVSLPITVPEGYVWLMGDNRPNSGDSRFFGPQPVSAVQGRAFWTYWPPGRFGRLE